MKSSMWAMMTVLSITILSSECLAQIIQPQEVHQDRRVTFRVGAPNAHEVKVISKSDGTQGMGADEYLLKKGDDGIWVVTTNPCRPGFHYYELSIDGFHCPDPASLMFYGYRHWMSAIDIPDEQLDFYEYKNVPHGDVRHHWYRSKATDKIQRYVIYTPPDYDENTTRRYPVLYL